MGVNAKNNSKALLFLFTETAANSNVNGSHYFVLADVYKYLIGYNGKFIPSENEGIWDLKMIGLNSNYSSANQKTMPEILDS